MVSDTSTLHHRRVGVMIYCPTCGEKLRVKQSSVQIYNGKPTIWRRRVCANANCRDGSTHHSIEIEKPDDMEIDYG